MSHQYSSMPQKEINATVVKVHTAHKAGGLHLKSSTLWLYEQQEGED